MSGLIPLPEALPSILRDYLPSATTSNGLPFVTLTYATSLDSRIAASPGTQTAISHLETKTMTHYIRSHHNAILVGVGTVLADDPGLNCRWKSPTGALHLIRPVIIDPHFKWNPEGSRLLRTYKEGAGMAPFVITTRSTYDSLSPEKKRHARLIQQSGGSVIALEETEGSLNWKHIFEELLQRGIESVMVEGGAKVINQLLLRPDLVSSLIVTVGPVYLGSQGVEVSPSGRCGLADVTWWTGVQDAVLMAHLENS